jgi:hypothetical protein
MDSAMMTSGLVARSDPDSREALLRAIRSEAPFTVGEESKAGFSLALETTDVVESQRWLDWLCAQTGVTGVEVVFVHWDDDETEVSVAGT